MPSKNTDVLRNLSIPKVCFILIILGCSVISKATAQTVIDSLSSLRGISVLNQDVVWVGGSRGLIAKTQDGGVTWGQLSIPETEDFEFRDVEVFNENEVLVMSAGEGEKSNIYRTEDAGVTWELVYANAFDKGFFNGFAFKDRQHGVLTGDPIDGKLFVLSTSDGGKTWKRIESKSLVKLKDGEIGGFSASGSHLFYREGLFVNGTGGKSSRIHIANSKLTKWKAIETDMIQGEGSQGIFSMDFCNAKVGIAVGGDYTQDLVSGNNVILTNDGGNSWRLADTFPVYQSSVRFIDCEHVMSTGPQGTYQSMDGGKTWNKMNVKGFHTLDKGQDGSVWAAGSGGRIMKIKNGNSE